MKARSYTYRDLIQAYVASRRQYPHNDFVEFHQRRFEILQNLFGIHFRHGDPHQELPIEIRVGAALMVFSSTVDSFLAIRTPWTGYLEGGLGINTLADMYGDPFFNLARQSEQMHLELLDALFNMLYGRRDEVFTSSDLLRTGFDDTTEPQMKDYWEYV
jgi:hypothetical protein